MIRAISSSFASVTASRLTFSAAQWMSTLLLLTCSRSHTLSAKKLIRDKPSFLLLSKLFNVEEKIKPGKFLIQKNTSLLNLIRMLRNNKQATVKFILNKVRTKADLAKLIANTFAIDSTESMRYLTSNDSLRPFDTDTTQVFTLFLPNTYEFYWSTPMNKLLQKMKSEENLFWSKNNRIEKAAAIGLTKNEVYTLASIVEEETNFDTDKSIIASVYQNRLKKKVS
jgi:UPF0755 protein